jgi:hypothetical protein
MKLIIRDDDLNYFSSIEKIERIYKGIWEKYPVHFAAIPNIYATQRTELPKNIQLEKEYYKINENKELVDFIKGKIKENKVVIWQHGYTHKDYGKLHDLERHSEAQIYRELKKGKELLEKTFNVKQIKCVKMALGEPDASGRRSVTPIPSSEIILDTDIVIMKHISEFKNSDLFEIIYEKEKKNISHYKPLKKLYIDAINLENGNQERKLIQDYSEHRNLKMYKISDSQNRFKDFHVSDDHSLIIYDSLKDTYEKISPIDLLEKPEHKFLIQKN